MRDYPERSGEFPVQSLRRAAVIAAIPAAALLAGPALGTASADEYSKPPAHSQSYEKKDDNKGKEQSQHDKDKDKGPKGHEDKYKDKDKEHGKAEHEKDKGKYEKKDKDKEYGDKDKDEKGKYEKKKDDKYKPASYHKPPVKHDEYKSPPKHDDGDKYKVIVAKYKEHEKGKDCKKHGCEPKKHEAKKYEAHSAKWWVQHHENKGKHEQHKKPVHHKQQHPKPTPKPYPKPQPKPTYA